MIRRHFKRLFNALISRLYLMGYPFTFFKKFDRLNVSFFVTAAPWPFGHKRGGVLFLCFSILPPG